MKDNSQTILTPYISLDTPGKATVEVVILADPVCYLLFCLIIFYFWIIVFHVHFELFFPVTVLKSSRIQIIQKLFKN